MRITTALAILALTPAVATAQGGNCHDATTQSALNMCAARELDRADAALNEAYATLRERVSEPERGLRDAQRAWIAYRDAQCAFESAGTEGGSIHPMIVAFCLADVTRAQTERLKRQIDCEEGDLSCGGQ